MNASYSPRKAAAIDSGSSSKSGVISTLPFQNPGVRFEAYSAGGSPETASCGRGSVGSG